MKYRILISILIIFWGSHTFSQTDDCVDAELLIVEKTCITKAGFTNDLINEPLDNSCGGDTDDDGWYKFKAISESTVITVISATGDDMGIAIFLDDCERERTCANATTQGGTETITFATQIGREYFIQVYDVRQGPGAFFICLTTLPKEPISDCDNAEVICTSGAIEFNPTGPGKDDFEIENNYAGCLLSKENQSAWYYFEIQPTAPPDLFLNFSLTPDNSPDYDFAIFGPNVDCEGLGYPIRCSYADKDCGFCSSTGMGMNTKDATENARGDGFVTSLTVQPGEGFFLLIDNFSVTATGFILEWGGTAAPYLNCKAETPCGLFVETGPSLFVCEPESIALNAEVNLLNNSSTDDLIYAWEGTNDITQYLDDTTSATPLLTFPNNFTGNLDYLLTVRKGACRHIDRLRVTKECLSAREKCTTPIQANFDILPPNCTNSTSGSIQTGLIEGGMPPYHFQLEGVDFQSNFIFPNLAEGTYLISILDAYGCQLDTFLTLTAIVNPTLDLGMDRTINQGNQIEILANTNISPKQIQSIDWIGLPLDTCTAPCLNLNIAPLSNLNLTATLTTYEDCQVIDDLEIFVNPQSDIYIPNAFSPNGDGINDIFFIHTGSGISNIQTLQIFDRWGNLVFRMTDISPNTDEFGWDGTYQNRILDNGTFVYVADISLPSGQLERLVGEVVLIRF